MWDKDYTAICGRVVFCYLYDLDLSYSNISYEYKELS